jgi:hypothetical protein
MRCECVADEVSRYDRLARANGSLNAVVWRLGDPAFAGLQVSSPVLVRYFASKEDVVLGDPMVYGEPVRQRLAEALESMPDGKRCGLASNPSWKPPSQTPNGPSGRRG